MGKNDFDLFAPYLANPSAPMKPRIRQPLERTSLLIFGVRPTTHHTSTHTRGGGGLLAWAALITALPVHHRVQLLPPRGVEGRWHGPHLRPDLPVHPPAAQRRPLGRGVPSLLPRRLTNQCPGISSRLTGEVIPFFFNSEH